MGTTCNQEIVFLANLTVKHALQLLYVQLYTTKTVLLLSASMLHTMLLLLAAKDAWCVRDLTLRSAVNAKQGCIWLRKEYVDHARLLVYAPVVCHPTQLYVWVATLALLLAIILYVCLVLSPVHLAPITILISARLVLRDMCLLSATKHVNCRQILAILSIFSLLITVPIHSWHQSMAATQ